jgi:arylsulfatase A-like enzyme
MTWRSAVTVFVGVLAGILDVTSAARADAAAKPNIVFILADDLGYGEVGCYGQTKIKTPNIDRLAAEGMRFTQAYAGAAVCAPSRSTLMTGLHTGHTPIRSNGGGKFLAAGDVSLPQVLKDAGYATGGFGKWGLGVEGTTGQPNRHGFDEFFGYYHQVHAHVYYPYWLSHNGGKAFLPENEGRKQNRYSADEIQAQALAFVRRNKDRPFFLYLPSTLPHVELVVPEDSMKPYRGKWKEEPLPDPRPGYLGADEPYATFAGMVSRLDRHVGEVLAVLKELGLDERTLVIFTSDNGPQGGAWKRVADFFQGNGPLRGYKSIFYEGGFREPFIARWPGHVKPGTVSDHVCAFWDVLPTLADVAGAPTPRGLDGISFAPTLIGRGEQKRHDYLYWEIHNSGGLTQAVRMGDWKYLQSGGKKPPELYDLARDPGEKDNVADKHPEVVATIKQILSKARTEERTFPREKQPTIKDYVR